MQKTGRFLFRATPERLQKLSKMANETGVSMSHLLNLMIDKAEVGQVVVMRQQKSTVHSLENSNGAFCGN